MIRVPAVLNVVCEDTVAVDADVVVSKDRDFVLYTCERAVTDGEVVASDVLVLLKFVAGDGSVTDTDVGLRVEYSVTVLS